MCGNRSSLDQTHGDLTGKRVEGDKSTAATNKMANATDLEEDLEAEVDQAKQHPGRFTHRFWLRQYSDLHQPRRTDPVTPTASCGAPSPTRSASNCAHRDDPQTGAQPSKTGQRLLKRWNCLLVSRKRPTSTTNDDSLEGEPRFASDSSRAPLRIQTSTTGGDCGVGSNLEARRHNRKRKRLRTSGDMPVEHQKQQQQQHQRRAHSSNVFGCQLCGVRKVSGSSPSSLDESMAACSDSNSTRSLDTKQMQSIELTLNRRDVDKAQVFKKPNRLGSWLLRSVSNSSSALMETKPDLTSRAKRRGADSDPNRLSPYRQIARFLGANRTEYRASSDEQQVGSGSGGSNLFTGFFSPSRKGVSKAEKVATEAQQQKVQLACDESKPSGARLTFACADSAIVPDKSPCKLATIRGKGRLDAAGAVIPWPSPDCVDTVDTGRRDESVLSRANFKIENCSRDLSRSQSGLNGGGGGGGGSQSKVSKEEISFKQMFANSNSNRDHVNDDDDVQVETVRDSNDNEQEAQVNEITSPRGNFNSNASFRRTKNKSGGALDLDRGSREVIANYVKVEIGENKIIIGPSNRTSFKSNTNSTSPKRPDSLRASSRSIRFASRSRTSFEELNEQQNMNKALRVEPQNDDDDAKRREPESPTSSSAFLPLIKSLASPSTSSSNSSSSISSSVSVCDRIDSSIDLSESHSQQAVSQLIDDQPLNPLLQSSSLGLNSVEQTGDKSRGDADHLISRANKDQQPRPSSQPSQKSSSNKQQQVRGFKSNFKKFVKRQQSVDSYRMARDLKQKLRRQQEGGRSKHQSNEAIKATRSVGDEPGGRKFSMRNLGEHRSRTHGDNRLEDSDEGDHRSFANTTGRTSKSVGRNTKSNQGGKVAVEICVDPYARPGSFILPGEQKSANETNIASGLQPETRPRLGPTPPNTLSLMPTNLAGSSSSLLMGSGFSGCITPTYPTHHLPSPKYVTSATLMAMQKKYSNASTISSSLAAELGTTNTATSTSLINYQTGISNGACGNFAQSANGGAGGVSSPLGNNADGLINTAQNCQPTSTLLPSDSESSFSVTPSGRASKATTTMDETAQTRHRVAVNLGIQIAAANEEEAAAAAIRRANLAEHIYDNKCGLGEDMKFLASLPELCDITFLVGETREPVCAVKSVLAARSRVFHKILFGNQVRAMAAAAAAALKQSETSNLEAERSNQTSSKADQLASETEAVNESSRRSSSPRQGMPASTGRALVQLAKSSLPSSRSTSPNQQPQPQAQQHQQWSVTSDASGYNASRPAPPTRAESSIATNRSGRASGASNGRESISQASIDSQQPLIIGPGQTATPAPKQTKKKHRLGRSNNSSAGLDGVQNLIQTANSSTSSSGAKNNRLSRMFMHKRASDPSIKHNQATKNLISALPAANTINNSSDFGANLGNGAMNLNYLDKMSSSQRSTTMIIEEFEPDVFRQLIEYIHTGCVLLQARTLLGLLNAADYYGLEQLRKACLRFVSCCITVDTVCSLLSTAERYIQYKCTKSIVQKVLEFVDTHANEIFKLNAFGLLPEHVVRLILARDGLQADEHHKYNGVYTWCEHYCRSYELTNIADIMQNFLDLIQFHRIPTNVLLSEIYPTHIVPDDIFLSALAYQADPSVFEPEPARPRRMTLPNTIIFKDFGSNDNNNSEIEADKKRHPGDKLNRQEPDEEFGERERRATNYISRRQSNSAASRRESTLTTSSQQKLLLSSRKSTGTSLTSGSKKAQDGSSWPSKMVGRKGSIAQVSISGVMRLSHKLSIRKRHSNAVVATSSSTSNSGRRGSSVGQQTAISKQSSLAFSIASGTNGDHQSRLQTTQHQSRDPIQVGRQILDAYLLEQQQRELEEEEAKRRLEAERLSAEEAKRQADTDSGIDGEQQKLSLNQQQRAQAKRPLIKTPSSSTRKSFRDFKYISRRLFMRHSSSKTLQSQQSSASITSTNTSSLDKPSLVGETLSQGAGGDQKRQHRRLGQLEKAPSAGGGGANSGAGSSEANQPQEKSRRSLLKIKRSETVFEAAPTSTNPSRLLFSSSAKKS